MDPITVSLPDAELREYVDKVVSNGSYDSAGNYLLTLIREDRIRRAGDRLEKLLLEGLEGEAALLTDRDWDEMRREYDERQSQASSS